MQREEGIEMVSKEIEDEKANALLSIIKLINSLVSKEMSEPTLDELSTLANVAQTLSNL